VWDRWVRVGHWLLVVSIAATWVTRHGGGAWHEWPGYVALIVAALRVAWGFVGSLHARFSDFVRAPKEVIHYLCGLRARRETHYVGHNPLGGYMVLALLALVTLTGLSGWLYTTDRFWGVEWVGETHDFLADALLVLVAAHIAGVLFTSHRDRENLIAAMFHGKKRMR
jgi:cytochrome b